MRRRGLLAPTFIAIAMLGACKDGSSPPVPGSLTAAAGDQQAAVVGTALPTAPAVLLKDTKGRPMNGVPVTFAVTSGGGSLGGLTLVKTGKDGIARAGTWTLGTSTAQNKVSATVEGLPPFVFSANAQAGSPATATAMAGDNQSATVGTAVSTPPSIKLTDNFGNPVANIAVTFVAAGGGSVVGGSAVTDASGTATVGGWTLATLAGANSLTATSTNGVSVTFNATGTAGAATQMASFAGDNQSIAISTSVPVKPAVVVRDQYGNGVPGVTVTFSVVSGGGTTTGATQTTGATGIATVGSWILGANQGPNQLVAQANGLGSINFNATATEALIYTMVVSAGNGLSTPTGWTTTEAPAVLIKDQNNNPAIGRTVTFTVASGGGSLTGATATTDNNGIARANWWRLGNTIGANTVTATSAGLPNVTFSATAVAPPPSAGGYNISVAYAAPATARQQQAVVNAVTRWQQVITGDLSDINNFTIPALPGCYPAFTNESIDDIMVIVDFSFIDGPSNILGSASWCAARQSNALPAIGRLRLDAADLTAMETNGNIDDVVLHEIGHILGIGTLWGPAYKNLLAFGGTDSTTFTGPTAGAAFLANGGGAFVGSPVPVENCKTAAGVPINGCGSGTRDGHWREAVLLHELMTGYISGTVRPLSAITIQSLGDLGYTVNAGAADAFIVGAKPIPGAEPAPVFLNEAPANWQKRFIDDR